MTQRKSIEVSVVIPTYNSARTLNHCLASIVANVTSYNYEIIVVDAGSQDSTIEIAKLYSDKVIPGIPRRINRNIGVNNSSGKIICFTDSDCKVPENWIDCLCDGLLKLSKKDHSLVGVGGGNILNIENPTLMEHAVIKSMTSPLVSFKARNVALYDKEFEVQHNPPMNSAYFKWAIEEVDGFQEEYGYGGEDLELDAKLTGKHYKLYYLPYVTVVHMHRAGFKKFVRQMFKLGVGRIKVGSKYSDYLQFHHYGPVFLCLMSFTPFIVIPLIMALVNSCYVTLKDKNLLMLLPVIILTMAFYIAYGLGEISEIVKVWHNRTMKTVESPGYKSYQEKNELKI